MSLEQDILDVLKDHPPPTVTGLGSARGIGADRERTLSRPRRGSGASRVLPDRSARASRMFDLGQLRTDLLAWPGHPHPDWDALVVVL